VPLINVHLKPGDDPAVYLDGKRLEGVVGLSVPAHDRLGMPVVQVALAGEVIVDGVDIPMCQADPAGDVVGFLRAIDPKQLERDALRNADMETDMGALILAALLRYAEGKPS